MKYKIYAALTMLLLNTTAYADAILKTVEDVKIEAINDKEVNSGLLQFKNKEFRLSEGQHTLAVRYSAYFEEYLNIGTHEIVKSDLIELKTPYLKDNQNYLIKLIQTPQNINDARLFAKSPEIGLYDIQGKLLAKASGIDRKKYNSNTVFKSPTISTNDSNDQNYVKMSEMSKSTNHKLIETWQNSSKQERQQFMNWLAEH